MRPTYPVIVNPQPVALTTLPAHDPETGPDLGPVSLTYRGEAVRWQSARCIDGSVEWTLIVPR